MMNDPGQPSEPPRYTKGKDVEPGGTQSPQRPRGKTAMRGKKKILSERLGEMVKAGSGFKIATGQSGNQACLVGKKAGLDRLENLSIL